MVAILREDFTALERCLFWIENHVALAVEHALQVLERNVENRADAARKALEEPDVRNWSCQGDVAEPFTADLALNDLDTAFLTHDAAMLHALVLAANAFVVFDGSEDLCAEEAVTLWLERTVVDGFRLANLAV